MNRDEIILFLRRFREKYDTKYNILRIGVFGSAARDRMNDKSDIDILVEFQGRKSLLNLARLKLDLEEKLNRKVDVLTYKSLHPLLKDRILAEQVEIL